MFTNYEDIIIKIVVVRYSIPAILSPGGRQYIVQGEWSPTNKTTCKQLMIYDIFFAIILEYKTNTNTSRAIKVILNTFLNVS